tara:strand:- start:1862 stop:2047 length:186 start_codon:yes stop_codon:yes gene_type:complete
MPKPIEDIKDDMQSVVFNVNKLQLDIKELKELNIACIKKLEKYLNEDIVKVKKKKNPGWFY